MSPHQMSMQIFEGPKSPPTRSYKSLIVSKSFVNFLKPRGQVIGSISNFVMTEWTPEGQADQTPKSLGLRIIRRLRETFVVNEHEVFIGLGASEVNP
jgi:hypothetical protein